MPEKENCENCLFSKPRPEDDLFECRRYPPQTLALAIVNGLSWCGEYKPIKEFVIEPIKDKE